MGRDAAQKASAVHKSSLGCWVICRSHLCGCYRPLLVVIQWKAWVREDQWLTNGLIKSRFFMFLSTVSSRFSLILCPRRRLGVLVGQVGSVGEEFKDIEGGILGWCFWEFWCRLTRLVLDKGPLNGCCCIVKEFHFLKLSTSDCSSLAVVSCVI